MNTVFAGVAATVFSLVGLTVLGGSWYTVDSGYRGVQTRNGAVTGVAEPGLGFKMPLIDKVIDIVIARGSFGNRWLRLPRFDIPLKI